LVKNRRHIHRSSERQAVELLRCRHGLSIGAVQLPLLDHVHGLDSFDQFLRTPKRLEPEHRICDSLHGPVVLLDDVVQIFGLPQLNIKAGVGIDATNGCRVGTAFVDGDFLWQTMQIDGALQVSSGRCQVTLGSEQEVHRIANLVDSAVQVFPFAGDFDVGFIEPPTRPNRALAVAKDECQDREYFQRPAVYGKVIDKDTALLHHFFQMAKAQRVSRVPTRAHQHHFQRVVQPLENLA